MQNIIRNKNISKRVLDFNRPFAAFPVAGKETKITKVFKTIGGFPFFGILPNDWLLVVKRTKWETIQPNALYVVFTNHFRIAGIELQENNLISLHDGLGANSLIYSRSSVDLIGEVVRSLGGEV